MMDVVIAFFIAMVFLYRKMHLIIDEVRFVLNFFVVCLDDDVIVV